MEFRQTYIGALSSCDSMALFFLLRAALALGISSIFSHPRCSPLKSPTRRFVAYKQ